MHFIEVERTLIRSPRELWDRLADHPGIGAWLEDARIEALEPPHRIQWSFRGASGVIELQACGWGTKVRTRVEPARLPAWERLATRYEIERALGRLYADLGIGSLQRRQESVRGRETPHR
jgi:hypothetical protein